MQVAPGGPDTHDNPHQKGAAREAAGTLFIQQETKLGGFKSLSILRKY